MRNAAGIMMLFMQYFRKGLVVVARKRKCLLNKINVVIFQLMMKTPIEAPTIPALRAFTFPRYSGKRNKAFAPKERKNPPLMVLNKMNQNTSRTWNFLKCNN